MTTEPDDHSNRPLSGVRVLAFTGGMPGALATMLLADYGAEVILVERDADGLLRRTGGHSLWHRGKSSIGLDLHDDADRLQAVELAAGADVVIEDRRPGHLARYGLGYDAVSASNPAVVYTSISGYGQDGRDRDRNGWDAAVAANLGVVNEWGGTREGPIFLGHPALDYSTAMLAVIGTLAAVRARVRTGIGDHVDVSLRDGALALYPMNWWTEASAEASIDQKSGSGDLRFGHKRLLLRVYECADGTLIQIHTGAAGAFDRAMEVFGLGDEVSKMQGDVQMSSLLTDRDLEIMEERLPGILRGKTRAEWLELLWSNEIAALPVGEPGEALDDDQVRHAGIVATLDDPALGEIEVVGPTILMSDTPGAISGPAPRFDEQGATIRAGGWRSRGLPAGGSDDELEHPLDGIRIVDFATFFAAPYGARLLSDLGADVVKVEGIHGDPMRPLVEIFEGANRGKRGTSVNLKSDEAREVVERLVKGSDVVLHNLRPGVAERLGIDQATLRAIEPDLIYQHSPGYGSSGPKSQLQSFSPLLSGFVGIFAIGAGEGNRPHATFGNEDYYNGLLGACACMLAIVHRERTGRGQYVETPQLHSSVFTTSEYYKAGGEYRSVIPRVGPELYGWSAGYRLYQCLVGWICVTCVDDAQVHRLATSVLPEDRLAELGPDDMTATAGETSSLATALSYHFVERTAEDWVTALCDVDVPAELVRDESWLPEQSFHERELIDAGRVIAVDHAEAGSVRMIGDVVHPTRLGTARKGPAPGHGEHTAEVFAAIGFDEPQTAAMVDAGAVVAARRAAERTA